MFLNVLHKDFGCSHDNFVNEFSTAASHLFFCDHFLYDVVTTVFGLVWLGFGLCWLWVGFALAWVGFGFGLGCVALVGFGSD